MGQEWIGFDLDGTLAEYNGKVNFFMIGEPVPKMVELLHFFRDSGFTVKIFTARVTFPGQIYLVQKWCEKHLGFVPEVTNQKDFDLIRFYDDRCIQVITNKGDIVNVSGNTW